MLDRFTLIRSVDARHSNHEPNKVFQTGNTEAAPRVNQLDLSFSKRLTFGSVKTDPKIDIFNALNTDAYYTVRSTTFTPVSNPALATGFNGSGGTYLQPGSILQGRLLRIAAVINW